MESNTIPEIPVVIVEPGNLDSMEPGTSDTIPMISIVSNCWVKQMLFEKQGHKHKGHEHTFDHQSLLAAGSVECTVNGAVSVHKAPTIIYIRAGLTHGFKALEDNTVMYCVHPLRDGERVEDIISPEMVPNGVMPLILPHIEYNKDGSPKMIPAHLV
jgi:quercetin dioxygenase-like cupin family protein